MTDDLTPEHSSRRDRLEHRRRRIRVLGVLTIVVLVVVGVGTATALRGNDDGATPGPGKHALAAALDPATVPKDARHGLAAPRALDHEHPLKLWIGGDSLAGSFGPALGQLAGATGVVDATIDYKVSSGLADNGIRNWLEHAQQSMASEDPDAVVFIIGTNDASIVNSQDSNNDGVPDWEVAYRQKIDEMMATFVGGARHRTVYWLGPPTLRDDTLDEGAKALGPVMQQEAKKFAPYVQYVNTYKLFSDSSGGYSESLPDAQGNDVQMRISDGVHFTVDGAMYLARSIWKLLDARWHIGTQTDPTDPIEYTIAQGSNDYVPGVGHYRPSVSHSHSSSGTTPTTVRTETTVVSATTTTPVTTRSTTPPTAPVTTTPETKPPATTPRTTPPTVAPTTP